MKILYLIATLLAATLLYRASRSTDSLPDDAMVSVLRVITGDEVHVRWRARDYTVCLSAIECADLGREAGRRARDKLLDMTGGRRVILRTHGVKDAGDVEATLYVLSPGQTDWLDVNAEMVRSGHARVYRCKPETLPEHRRDELEQLESEARLRGLGIWHTSLFDGENGIAPPR